MFELQGQMACSTEFPDNVVRKEKHWRLDGNIGYTVHISDKSADALNKNAPACLKSQSGN